MMRVLEEDEQRGAALCARRRSVSSDAARRRFRLPDGSERYLVDEALLMRLTEEPGGQLLDPLTTTMVQDQRPMTTWAMRKNG